MKAIVFAETGGPEVLTLADVPKPEVRPGMVLLKTHAIGVYFADTLFRQGRYAVAPKLPDTPGLEAAGVIEVVGSEVVGRFAERVYGARFFGFGDDAPDNFRGGHQVRHHRAALAARHRAAIGVAVASTIAATHTRSFHRGPFDPTALTAGYRWGFWLLAGIAALAVAATLAFVRPQELREIPAQALPAPN